MAIDAIAPLIAVIAYFPLLVVTTSSRPWHRRQVLFILFLISAMAWSLANYLDRSQTIANNPVLFKITISLFALTATQFHCFISSFYPPNRGRWLLFAYAAMLAFVVTAFTGYMISAIYVDGVYLRSVYRIESIFVMLPLLVIAIRNFYVFGRMLKGSSNPLIRSQVTALLLGVMIIVTTSLASVFIGFGGFPIAHYGNLLIAVIVSYAVIRHNLMDIRVVLRRGFAWVALVLLSLGGFCLLSYLVYLVFNFSMDVKTLIVACVLGLAVSFISLKVRGSLFTALSRVFQGDRYNYGQQLRRFTETIHRVFSLEEQGGELLTLLTRAIDIKQACLLLPEESSGRFVAQFAEPKDDDNLFSSLTLKADNPVIRYLEREQKTLTMEDLGILPGFLGMWGQEKEEIKSREIEMLIPLISREHLIAVMVVGRKKTGKYSLEDLRILEDVTRQAAVSIEKEYLRKQLKESEEKYHAIFEQAADSIVLIDVVSGRILNFNRRAYENLGYTREEFAGLSLNDIDVDYNSEKNRLHKERIRHEGTSFFETKQKTKHGEIRDILVSAKPVHAEGKTYSLVIWHDITESKRAEELLRASEEKYRAIFEQAVSSIALIDLDNGEILDFNDRACENLGYTREEFARLNLKDIDASDIAEFPKRVQDELINHGSNIVETKHKTKSGEIRDVFVSAKVVSMGGRRVVMNIWHDITESKRIEEELRQREAELSLINRSSAIMTSSLDIQEIYESFIEELKKVMDVTWAAIVIAETNGLCFAALSSEAGMDFHVGEKVALPGSGTEWVMEHREAVYEPDISAGSRFLPVDRYLRWGLRSMVHLPLIAKGGVIGSFIVASHGTNAFNERQIRLLEQLAIQIAMPIENSRLYAQAELKSRLDELSGLFNRRSLDEMIDREIGRHSRYGGIFSLAIMDLDSFKLFNDTYGHLAGDKLLRQVGRTIRNIIRGSDVAFRYGGDEFAILLPQTNIEAASSVVERLRKKIAEKPDSGSVRVTASIGLASWPSDGIGQMDIIAAADRSLYQAKRSGGNRVYCASGTLLDLSSSEGNKPGGGVTVTKVMDKIYALMEMVDAKDHYTRHHAEKVAEYSLALAGALNLEPQDKSRLEACALLHEVGIIGVSDEKLGNTPDMEDEEWRDTPRLGAAIVGHAPQLAGCAPGIRHAREWYNGSGYPDGLKGKAIPLDARIIAIADVFARLTGGISEADTLPLAEALGKIKESAGTRFDPNLVDKFVLMMEKRFSTAIKGKER